MSISPFVSVNQSFDEALYWVKGQLSQAGLRLVQTFDLHTARAGLHNCPCPNHGTQECDCQMMVILVYGKGQEPATLILHGNDGLTWLSITDEPYGRPDTGVSRAIKQALEDKVSN